MILCSSSSSVSSMAWTSASPVSSSLASPAAFTALIFMSKDARLDHRHPSIAVVFVGAGWCFSRYPLASVPYHRSWASQRFLVIPGQKYLFWEHWIWRFWACQKIAQPSISVMRPFRLIPSSLRIPPWLGCLTPILDLPPPFTAAICCPRFPPTPVTTSAVYLNPEMY